jgi:hypothetical protein
MKSTNSGIETIKRIKSGIEVNYVYQNRNEILL